MKIFLLFIVATCIGLNVRAQGLESIIVETYYVSDLADSLDADENFAIYPLKQGSVTYRVYVDMLPGYEFIQMFGSSTHPLEINSSTSFFNDPNYGFSVYNGLSVNNTRKNTALIDSYLTVGGVANGLMGVLKEEDTDGTIGNQQGILANANPAAGLPINGDGGSDGLMPGTPILPNTLGLSGALDVFDQSVGGSFLTTNGTIAALGGAMGVTASNHVLIGQFTTDGTLNFKLNIQILSPEGNDEIYVAENPLGSEQTHPSLIFESSPIVSVPSLLKESQSWNIFPNPCEEGFIIKGDIKSGDGYAVLNQLGQQLESGLLQGGIEQVDMSAYASGVYSLRIHSKSGSIATQQLIKR